MNLIISIVTICSVIYMGWMMNVIAKNPKPIVQEVCEKQCPSLPNNYFVVKTREDMYCTDSQGKSVLFKTIEQAKVDVK